MRRARGSGYVRYNAPRGRYEAVLVVNGTKRTRTVPSPEPSERGKRQIEKVLDQMRRQYGSTLSVGRETVAEYLERWLAFRASQKNLAWGTLRGHRSRIEAHIVPAIGKIALDSLTTEHVDIFIASLELAPSSVALVRKTLSNALTQAVKWRLINENPVSLTRAPKARREILPALTPEQALTFLDVVRGDRLEALWNLAACLGLRSAEVRGITWDEVESGASGLSSQHMAPQELPSRSAEAITRSRPHILHIRHTLGYRPGEWVLQDTKTATSNRRIVLPEFIATLVEQRRETQRFEVRSPGYSNPMDLVFTQPDGYPLSEQMLLRYLKLHLERAGLPSVTVHSLRHVAASLLLAKGVSIRATQDILGHATSRMTLETYAASDDTQRRDAAERLEKWRAQ